MGSDETTDKLFPEEMRTESAVIERPIPLTRSIRSEFVHHRLKVEEEFAAFRLELTQALERLSPPPTAGGAVRRGVAVAGRGGAVVVAVLGLLELVVPMVRPDLEGPLRALRQAFGGP